MKYILRWLRAVDVVLLAFVFLLILIGISLIFTSSVSMNKKFTISWFFITFKQLIYCFLGISFLLLISFTNEKTIKKIGFLGLLISFILNILVLFVGVKINGSKRWIQLGAFSIHPAEFIKIFLPIVQAHLLKSFLTCKNFLILVQSAAICSTLVSTIIVQPDVGLSSLIVLTFLFQLFLAGLPIVMIVLFCVFIICAVVLCYFLFPHVALRLNIFFNKSIGYQVSKALDCFKRGGMLGVGPAEGRVKYYLPDSHTDFIFSVAAEEMGAIFCCFLILVYALVVFRGFFIALKIEDQFSNLSISGLSFCFGMQVIINLGVNVNLLPTKGTSLPFISYGGSSMLSSCIAVGIILALSKTSHIQREYKIKQIF